MQHILAKSLIAVAALAATGLSQAQVVLGAGQIEGSGSLSFSDDLIGALAVAGIVTELVSPATGTITDSAISITAPVATVEGSQTGSTFTASVVNTLGGALMTAPTANFATNGGFLSVTNITVDLASNGIFATVEGDHGLTARTVRVWEFANLEGGTSFENVPGTTANNTLTGLTITSEAFDLFAQGLGLRAGGIAAMSSISDYGVMTSSITVVPEPSTYMMMGLGLVGLAFAAKRRQRA